MDAKTGFGIILAAVLLLVLSPPLLGGEVLEEGKPGPGDLAPLFTAQDLEGKRTCLEELIDGKKVVLLNFWGLRCSNCLVEIGYLNSMFEKYSPNGVEFLGVNVDGASSDVIRKNLPNLPDIPRYTILPDPEFKIPDLYNVAGAPLSFVIGKDGKILYRHEDFQPGDENGMEDALQKAMAEAK